MQFMLVSDALAPQFWKHHALLTGLASGVIVVMLSAALISEALERRGRRRWRVLAQHVMIELVGNARHQAAQHTERDRQAEQPAEHTRDDQRAETYPAGHER